MKNMIEIQFDLQYNNFNNWKFIDDKDVIIRINKTIKYKRLEFNYI